MKNRPKSVRISLRAMYFLMFGFGINTYTLGQMTPTTFALYADFYSQWSGLINFGLVGLGIVLSAIGANFRRQDSEFFRIKID